MPALRSGDRAPDFDLPAINRDGRIALSDYHGRSAVLVGLFRGLHCPFCRRQIVLLGRHQQALREAGVEMVGVVNTLPERGRFYFARSPVPIALAADPDTAVHAAYGLPKPAVVTSGSSWPASTTMEELGAARVNPTGELPSALNPIAANEALNLRDLFEVTPADETIMAHHALQLAGHFLVDRDGVVRWTHLEAPRSANAIAAFPTPAELLDAARRLTK
jgi:peroxiredoxin